MTAVIYARYSSDNQREESIEGQIRECTAYAEKNGITSTIEGVVSTTDELVAKCSLLADFKAVQNGHVWCVAQSFFQQSMELADFILELHRLFTEDAPDGLQYFIHVE